MSGPNEDSVEGTVPHVERRLAAILSADVKGYSRLKGNNDVATRSSPSWSESSVGA